ncbi:MAG: sugar-binding protein [Armatimonadota bacterium]
MRRLICLAFVLNCFIGSAFAQPGRLPATKKLIEYGWDVPTPEYVAANIREMEKRPFDGIIMRTAGQGRGNIFSGGRWDPKEYADDMKAMSSIKWGKFKHNFLMMYSRSEMDWFSDSDWDAVLSNVNLMAQIAKAGGCSLAFDAEPYGKNPWLWSDQKQGKTKTYAEYSAKARQRGKQFAETVGKIIPDNVTLTFFTYSLFRSEMAMLDPARREQALAGHSYSLYVPFLNGYLEGMGPRMTLTDGNEPSYYYDSSEKYLDAFHMMRQSALNLIPRPLVPKFQTQTQASQALYMDFVFAKVNWKNIQALYLSPEEQAKWFEHNVYWALKTTDEYVWLYSEKMDWWKNKDVPPGMEEAIIKARAAIAENRPLGWDLKDLMQSVQDKRRAAIAERLIKRTAEIPSLQGAAPKVDGVLDDAAWKDAAQLPNFVGYFGSTEDDIKAKTNAMVTYDQSNLYIAIRADEPEVSQMQIMGSQHDDSVWMGDSVDVFLTRHPSGTPYYHFILSPGNVQWDAEFATDNDMGYNPKWQSATKVGEKQWVAEIAIPWSALRTKPVPGLTLKANLTRQRKPGKGELSSWSQVLTGFMEPEQFGTWVLK